MSLEDHYGNHATTKYERTIEEGSEGLLGAEFTPNYSDGLRIDIKAWLRDSFNPDLILSKLNVVERFALLSYYSLRKTEKQLSSLIGLNECNFHDFIELLTQKVGALIALEGLEMADWDRVLIANGLGWFETRSSQKASWPQSKTVRTSSVISLYQGMKSWQAVGYHLGAYHSDLRKAIEQVSEVLMKSFDLIAYSIGIYLLSITEYASVKSGEFAGKMASLVGSTVRVKDDPILGQNVFDLDNIDSLFFPRALAARPSSTEQQQHG